MKKLPFNINEVLGDFLRRAHSALEAEDSQRALDLYDEIEGFIKVVDPFSFVPDTPGSLAAAWHKAHYYRDNDPKEPKEYLASIRSIVRGIEIWLAQDDQVFETPSKNLKMSSSFKSCPFFRRALPLDRSLVFMLMPFTEAWSNRIWSRHVKVAIERISWKQPLMAQRADDLFGSDVMIDIFESIMRARIVVADITNRNANVFYELGIAHTMGKSVLIIAQGAQHIPFDLLRFRHILYEDNSEGCERLEEALGKHVTEMLNEKEDNT